MKRNVGKDGVDEFLSFSQCGYSNLASNDVDEDEEFDDGGGGQYGAGFWEVRMCTFVAG